MRCLPVQMSRFVTLRKSGQDHRFLLHKYEEVQGGRLDQASTLHKLQLVSLERKYEGEPDFVPVSFALDGLSRERFQAEATIEVSGQGEGTGRVVV
jgi:hypothetical protein